jgi:5'-nucleotidase
MKILCTNDDGIHARGIELSVGICESLAEDVFVVAPDREQSATSHSLTLYRPLRPTARGPHKWAVDGTPTDCVLLANGALLPTRPDIVVSGVNHGPNMGEDVLYSGTVAAAMEGLSLGLPAVALSFAGHDFDLLPTWRAPLTNLLRSILAHMPFPVDTLLNVNLPPIPGDAARGVRITTLGSRVYEESIQHMKDPWGRDLYWIGGGQIRWTGSSTSDFQAIADHFVSVTPLHLDLTHYASLEPVSAWALTL